MNKRIKYSKVRYRTVSPDTKGALNDTAAMHIGGIWGPQIPLCVLWKFFRGLLTRNRGA